MERLTAYQLAEWEAYDKLDPIGTWRDDYRMAYLASLMNNITISVHGKKGAKHSLPIDFMPVWDVQKQTMSPKKQTMEDMKAFALNFAKAHNAQFKKEERVNSRPPRLGNSSR